MRERASATSSWLAPLLLVAAAGCGSNSQCSSTDVGCGAPVQRLASASALLDERGGTVAIEGGPSLVVPPGALDTATLVRIEEVAQTSRAAPRQYAFTPDGQVFARPVEVSFPVPATTTRAFVYWADGAGGFDPIGGSVAGGEVRARVAHFSGGYVGDAGAVRTVTGSRVTTNVRTRGITNEPVDLSGEIVAAHVLRADGSYDAPYPGEGRADGTFRIPAVPVGAYVLQVGNRFVHTTADVVDMGKVVPGRRGLHEIDTSSIPAAISLSLTNLAPWNDGTSDGMGDRLDLYSPDANDWTWGVPVSLAPGATSLDVTADLLRGGTHKVPVFALDAAAGDELVVAQQSVRTAATGQAYRALSRVIASGPVSVPAKPIPALQGAFQDATAHAVTVSWAFGSFDKALVADANPRAVRQPDAFGNSFRILGQAGGLAYGTHELTGKPDFLQIGVAQGTESFAPGALQYAVPPWGDWGAHWQASVDRFVPVQSGAVTGSFVVSLRVSAAMDSDVTLAQPALGLARHPRVNGRDLFVPQAHVGVTPTLTWDEPSPGPADAYMVQVVSLVGTGNPPWRYVAFFDTTEPRATLPPGVLEPGATYLAVIRSYRRSIHDEAPLRVFLPLHQSIQVTETFTP